MKISFITRWFRFLTRADRTTRFEILLPLNYNDGAEIEAVKFDETADELSERFSAVTQDTVRVTGTWKYGGMRYRDTLLRMRVDTADRDATEFFKSKKEAWKARFRQLDIWITAHTIDII